MIKKIRKHGESLVLVLDKEDIMIYGFKDEDIVEIKDIKILNKKELVARGIKR